MIVFNNPTFSLRNREKPGLKSSIQSFVNEFAYINKRLILGKTISRDKVGKSKAIYNFKRQAELNWQLILHEKVNIHVKLSRSEHLLTILQIFVNFYSEINSKQPLFF